MMKVEYSDYGDDKIPSNSTDLIINQSPLFTCHTHRSIMKYRNIIKVVIATYWGFHWDKYIPSKYILIDEQFNYQTYINSCPHAYNILTTKCEIPVLINKLSYDLSGKLPKSSGIRQRFPENRSTRIVGKSSPNFRNFCPIGSNSGDFRFYYTTKIYSNIFFFLYIISLWMKEFKLLKVTQNRNPSTR